MVNCGGAADWPTSTKVLLGKHAVATAAGEHHKLLRKVLRPPFSVTAVNDLMPRMADIARSCCDRWASQGRGKGLVFAKDYTFTVTPMSCMHLALLTLHMVADAAQCSHACCVQHAVCDGGLSSWCKVQQWGVWVGQIALDIILGFDESLLNDATIESCTEAFSVWNDGLFSFPINLPGTGAALTVCSRTCVLACASC